jgi:ATP-dependent helicase/nuclease subunit A
LREATILGREVPFAIPWEDNDAPAVLRRKSTIMQGVVDLIYRLHGQVWVADYKTDRVDETEIRTRARDYGMQARVYREAVARCLGLDVREVGFQFVFLAGGGAVTVLEEALPC